MSALRTAAAAVGVLAVVELTSGVLQGWYTPMLTDIARALEVPDADVNWLEGGQLMLSALVVPAFARLGDMVGHKRMLLWSIAVTALASLALPVASGFGFFLVAWALQGVYAVWLPMQIALIWSRVRHLPNAAAVTTAAAGILVASLELGAIVGALGGGALVDTAPLPIVLLVPGVLVVLCFVAVLLGVPASTAHVAARFDTGGLLLLTLALLALMGGLVTVRTTGPASPLPWLLIVLGAALLWPFSRYELSRSDPLIDVRMFASPSLRPVFLIAGLFGVSVLGVQAPMSTFARTDPTVHGFGLGTGGFTTSLIIGVYLIAMIVGALLYPRASRRSTPRIALIGASLLVAAGFLALLPLHGAYGTVIACMSVVGLGSGALVAALPAAAAAAAPASSTGVATGLTNSVKTLGGAIASAAFGLMLVDHDGGTAASFAGYIGIWIVCAATALGCALLMLTVPRTAFTDSPAGARNP